MKEKILCDRYKRSLFNKIKAREILKNCCIQKRASKSEIQHWKESIKEYDKEIFVLCEITGENEYKILAKIKENFTQTI